jgi:hypothetical protein
MSGKGRSRLQEHAGPEKHGGMQRRKLDERVRRTHQRLGSALVELIQEKSIDDVTVPRSAGSRFGGAFHVLSALPRHR